MRCLMKKPRTLYLTVLLLAVLFPAVLFAQSEGAPPEGFSQRAWNRAQKRWKHKQFPAHITGPDSVVITGQIYALEGDTLLLWPSDALFVTGQEGQLLRLPVADLESIHILRKRRFWKRAGKTALIVGGPALLLDIENADGDFLPPAVHLLVTGALITTPIALIAGTVHKAGQVDKTVHLSRDPAIDAPALKRLTKYALYPAGPPPSLPIGERQPDSLGPASQEMGRSVAYSPLLKKLFHSRGIFLEFHTGVGYRAAPRQMARAIGQAPPLPERPNPLVIGGEAMIKVKPHWRAGAAFQYSYRVRMRHETPIMERAGYSYFKQSSFTAPIFLAGLVEYVHQPMYGLRHHRWEWGAAAGPSIVFTEVSQKVSFRQETGGRAFSGGWIGEALQLPGLLLQGRLRFYPHKNVSIGLTGQLHGVLPHTVDKLIFDPIQHRPQIDTYLFEGASAMLPVSIPAHTIHFSAVGCLGSLGLNF